ncbi:hypothetical protein M427DRAFT_29559 [Gonapodya prolifera JEL478]|uniref:Uncharacterized protein n=1 Tax=Gonapodya prolifera (strain JEL478) TaxID=1344416 RepID=A0A139APH3_GONPJ|nr:hypothetical protein M427DRAFT_29559 [Gonapodya prolifera JEL478]|eukprot:KXS18657.1 hypothetical protein M427DRAFT_29559 [Gonapodya prolifera JEL478]
MYVNLHIPPPALTLCREAVSIDIDVLGSLPDAVSKAHSRTSHRSDARAFFPARYRSPIIRGPKATAVDRTLYRIGSPHGRSAAAYYIASPGLAQPAPVLSRNGASKPSYALLTAGTWGTDAEKINNFYPVLTFSTDTNVMAVKIGSNNTANETYITGSVSLYAGGAAAHLEHFADMFWFVKGMRTKYTGTIAYNGQIFDVFPEASHKPGTAKMGVPPRHYVAQGMPSRGVIISVGGARNGIPPSVAHRVGGVAASSSSTQSPLAGIPRRGYFNAYMACCISAKSANDGEEIGR